MCSPISRWVFRLGLQVHGSSKHAGTFMVFF
jgi:hypothetical protein